MLHGSVRLAGLAAILALGAIGATLALMGLGLPYLPASLLSAAIAGLVQHAALRAQPPPDRSAEIELRQQIEAYRAHTAALRHDLRGVLSPALMMSDRLLKHPEAAVQRAGNAVVRSIDRATELLASSRDLMAPAPPVPGPAPSNLAPSNPAPGSPAFGSPVPVTAPATSPAPAAAPPAPPGPSP